MKAVHLKSNFLYQNRNQKHKFVNILLVDDHQIVIDGIKTLLIEETFIDQIEEANNAQETMLKISERRPDLILLDINLPDESGFELCKKIKAKFSEIKIIALTMHDNSGYINQMIKNGVDGYILKNTGKQELLKAISSVMEGERYFSTEVIDALVAGKVKPKIPRTSDFIQKLTRREKEILRLVVEEMTTEEIGEELFISPSTVISHRKSLLRKLNAKNTAGLVKKAFEFGILEN